jgi:hypothetical protein
VSISFFSCKKPDPKPEPEPEPATGTTTGQSGNGSVKIVLNHRVGPFDLVFQKKYESPASDSITVTKLMYYLSNFKLVTSEGVKYIEKESYHLVDHSNSGSLIITLSDVPPGDYNGLIFMIGIDSLRNCSGSRSGALDPAKNMFWTWNSGYIFFKMEGKSDISPSKNYTYHVGGYMGTYKTQQNISINFPVKAAQVKADHTPVVNLTVNCGEIFDTPHLVDMTTTNNVMSEGSKAKMLAENYADMIFLKEVNN